MPQHLEYAPHQALPLPPISRLLMAVAIKVARWETNGRTRKALEKLDNHMLRDIGLTPAEAQAEWDKPFWWG